MQSRCLSLVSGLSILLILSGSEVENSDVELSCPPNAKREGTTCVCLQGFQSSRTKKTNLQKNEKCEDIDECKTGKRKCTVRAYCKNLSGSYLCSCVPHIIWLNFVAGFVNLDNPECYEEGMQPPHLKGTQPSQIIWDGLKNNGSKKDIASNVTKYLINIERVVWNMTGKGNLPYFDVAFETKQCNNTQEKTLLEAGNNTMKIPCSSSFQGTTRGTHAVSLITYGSLEKILDASFFPDRNEYLDVRMNSHIVSGTVGTEKKVRLSKPMFLTFQNTQPGGARAKHLCVYWDKSQKDGGSWSTEGCLHVNSNDSHTTCKCSHLSSFAVLLAFTPQMDPVLNVITYVGMSLSICCLFMAALTFFLCRPIQNTGTALHRQLSICLFLAHLFFLIGIDQIEPKVLCSIIAGVLHYLYLAAFLWMFLEGLHLFLTVRNLKVANYSSANWFKKRFIYPLGYGVPAVIVGLSSSLGSNIYGTPTHCWIKIGKGFIWSFMAPVGVIIVVNLLFYFQILWILRSKISSLNKEVSTIQDTRVMTFKAIAQLFILGCPWGFGFLMVKSVGKTAGLIFTYIFTITNVLQGVILFVVHCLLNRQVRMEYKKWLSGVRKGSKLESTDISKSTTQTKMEETGKPLETERQLHIASIQLQPRIHNVSALWQTKED